MKKILVAIMIGLMTLVLLVFIGFITYAVQPSSETTYEQGITQQDPIGTEEAKRVVLANAGLSDVDYIRTELEVDDGRLVYEIEFRANGLSYDYTIDAVSGAILEKEEEERPNSEPALHEPTHDIGQEQAKQIALTHAGVAEADAVMLEVKGDTEDGRPVYEVEFQRETTSYDYTLDAANGDIINWESEMN